MSTVLQVIPYPTLVPRHGGQIRAHHIARVLAASGHTVRRMPVFSRSLHPESNEEPVIDLDRAQRGRRYPAVWQAVDLTSAELAATDDGCFQDFVRFADAARPDVVVLEEPWLWPAVRRWCATRRTPPPVIYNAYNIESRAKADIFADGGVAEADAISREVEELERAVTAGAAGVSVTTAADAAVIGAWTSQHVVVAANGAVPRELRHLHGILPVPLEPYHTFLLFVGSAHPPNATGFWELVAPALPVLRSGELIVVSGSVAQLIQPGIEKSGQFYLARDRLVLLGYVSELVLDCLLANARGMLLPITYGGGSNLKTPEALISGLPMVATSRAFRGFEAYAGFPGVTIADTPEAFAAGIRALLDAPGLRATVQPRRELLWESTLRPIVALIDEVTAGYPKSAYPNGAG